MTNDRVRDAYDRIATSYAANRDQFKSLRYLEAFATYLPPGGTVLDLGCGAGLPVDAFLVERGYSVHGLDLSSRMIELARVNVPQATYEVRDMTDLEPGAYRVDGIAAFYSIFHTPRERHQRILDTMASFLPNGGPIVITMGSGEWEGVEEFHGAAMYWSHFGPETNLELVRNAGFTVVSSEIDESGNEAHQVIIAIAGR